MNLFISHNSKDTDHSSSILNLLKGMNPQIVNNKFSNDLHSEWSTLSDNTIWEKLQKILQDIRYVNKKIPVVNDDDKKDEISTIKNSSFDSPIENYMPKRLFFTGADFQGSRLPNAKLEFAYLEKSTFQWADLRNSEFKGAFLKGVNFTGAFVQGSNFLGAILSTSHLSSSNFSNSILIGADLSKSDMQKINLEKAILSFSNLSFANLKNSNLSSANLSNSNLESANLREANLFNVDLRGADLTGADLRGADLRNVNITGAKLKGANFAGAQIDIVELANYKSKSFVNFLSALIFKKSGKSKHMSFMRYKSSFPSLLETLNKFDLAENNGKNNTEYRFKHNFGILMWRINKQIESKIYYHQRSDASKSYDVIEKEQSLTGEVKKNTFKIWLLLTGKHDMVINDDCLYNENLIKTSLLKCNNETIILKCFVFSPHTSMLEQTLTKKKQRQGILWEAFSQFNDMDYKSGPVAFSDYNKKGCTYNLKAVHTSRELKVDLENLIVDN